MKKLILNLLFLFVLVAAISAQQENVNVENESVNIEDQFLPETDFEYEEIDIEQEGFFTGLWHGLRTPFAFIINLFKAEKYVIYSANGNVGYTIGYLIAVMFVLSIIFGGTRRRYKRADKGD